MRWARKQLGSATLSARFLLCGEHVGNFACRVFSEVCFEALPFLLGSVRNLPLRSAFWSALLFTASVRLAGAFTGVEPAHVDAGSTIAYGAPPAALVLARVAKEPAAPPFLKRTRFYPIERARSEQARRREHHRPEGLLKVVGTLYPDPPEAAVFCFPDVMALERTHMRRRQQV